jgi:ATP-dependent RNA helicase RhlE
LKNINTQGVQNMTFQDLKIIHPILKALEQQGYKVPSPIQEQAIPILLSGQDLLGSAQTGTGKTAAFAIPIIQGISQNKDHNPKRVIKALILAPTRELAEQIKDSFKTYARNLYVKTEAVYGGVSQRPQEAFLRNGIDVLVATPGRLWDLMRQGKISLASIKYLVLDEADNMLDMGFIDTVKKIVAKIPSEHQTMLFSATIPHEIMDLAKTLLKNPARVAINPEKPMIDKIEQTVYFVNRANKTKLLTDLMIDKKISSALIFTRTKRGADKLEKEMVQAGFKVGAIHGNKSQSKRNYVLKSFKDKRIQALIATDVAARGIDISNLSHVINYELPETSETYIHRMGRTGRAGLAGQNYSFCSQEEAYLLKMIEKNTNQKVKIENDHKYMITINPREISNPYKPHRQKSNNQSDRGPRQRRFNSNGPRSDRRNQDFKARSESKVMTKPTEQVVETKPTFNKGNSFNAARPAKKSFSTDKPRNFENKGSKFDNQRSEGKSRFSGSRTEGKSKYSGDKPRSFEKRSSRFSDSSTEGKSKYSGDKPRSFEKRSSRFSDSRTEGKSKYSGDRNRSDDRKFGENKGWKKSYKSDRKPTNNYKKSSPDQSNKPKTKPNNENYLTKFRKNFES